MLVLVLAMFIIIITNIIHEEFKTFAKEQIRAKFEHFESQVKSSKVKSRLNW